ncbi:Golgi reassembly-stacking protein 2 isoform X2 [Episyrphus balteatus]|uniref:Golgi reassembly-stacking protein 2 isoform X2 n=1 Tax=Episyrphus balteatus TaxID=286459 RepID=UPI002485435B|nr:Golgi reassembly-stacking protein 2 isoform X2 [Episyrphus balteatus]
MGAGHSVEVPGGGTEGYHVLRVQDNSPGQKAGLEAFFDFIVAIGNTRLDQDNDTLKELLKQNLDKVTKMTVYSSKTQTVRDVSITPSTSWGGQGLLGVSIRFCSFEGANENVWHVLEVHPSSPAETSGLRAFTDYIIGADAIRHETDDLFTMIETHENQILKIYVYNVEDDACREVSLKPNSKWGGDGSLGCGIGFGYLHRIPIQAVSNETKSALKLPTSADANVPTNVALQAARPAESMPPVSQPTSVNPSFPYIPPLTNAFTLPPPNASGPVAAVATTAPSDINNLANLQITSTSTTTVPKSEQQPSTNPVGIPPQPSAPPMNAGQPDVAGSASSFFQQQPTDMKTTQQFPAQMPPQQVPEKSQEHNSVAAPSPVPPPSQIPMFAQQSTFSNLPPPASIGNMTGSYNEPTAPSASNQFIASQQFYNPNNYPVPSQPPTSYQTNSSNVSLPYMQTFASYPQVQQTSVATPISLPGMPPLTVNTTIPTQALEGLNVQPTPAYPPVSN